MQTLRKLLIGVGLVAAVGGVAAGFVGGTRQAGVVELELDPAGLWSAISFLPVVAVLVGGLRHGLGRVTAILATIGALAAGTFALFSRAMLDFGAGLGDTLPRDGAPVEQLTTPADLVIAAAAVSALACLGCALLPAANDRGAGIGR
jgi:hypothetical protein